MNVQLNERIIRARKQAGLTQEQLGEALGVSRQAVSKWESGQANPDVTYVVKMCELFHLSADWLLLGREREPACGESPEAEPAGEETGPVGDEPLEDSYCLYLHAFGTEKRLVAKRIEELFRKPWAGPAFPWEGPIAEKEARDIAEMAPLVLCEGLTREQAEEARALFCNFPAFVDVFRDRDMTVREDGTRGMPKAEAETVAAVSAPREPLSGGAIFGLVVLGVIVGVLILSLF